MNRSKYHENINFRNYLTVEVINKQSRQFKRKKNLLIIHITKYSFDK